MIDHATQMGLLALILGLSACGEPASETGEREAQQAVSASSGGAAAAGSSAVDENSAPPPDLLTTARGAVLVEAAVNPAAALALIDGNAASHWSTSTGKTAYPYRFTFELIAPTKLSRIGVDGAGDRPGGVAGGSAREILIEGSAQGPEEGFRELAELVAAPEGETFADIEDTADKVRWLRFTVRNAHADTAAFIYLDEVLANGVPDPVDDSDRFAGIFQTGRVDFVELKQDGALISGCYIENSGLSSGTLNGSIIDSVALLNWRSDEGITGTALMNIDSAGALSGVRYRDKSRSSWGGPKADADIDSAVRCSDDDAPNAIADALEQDGLARIYGIHFEYDSDVPKPSARAALEQLRDALESSVDMRVAIEGHTDADGADDYNLDLSQRRARAVMRWLVDAGIDAGRLAADGKGENAPVASNDTADGKALNRRVEVRRMDQ